MSFTDLSRGSGTSSRSPMGAHGLRMTTPEGRKQRIAELRAYAAYYRSIGATTTAQYYEGGADELEAKK